MNKIEILFQIFLVVVIVLVIVALAITCLVWMGATMENKCAKQNYEGIIKFWDADVDCSMYRQDYGGSNE